MEKKVHHLYTFVQKLERVMVRVKQQQHQALRSRVDDFGKRRQAIVGVVVGVIAGAPLLGLGLGWLIGAIVSNP
jgi:hypothetical protein